MSSSPITPFTIDIPDTTLDTIRAKVAAYTWHEMPVIADGADRWAYGADMEYMKELTTYWLNTYDWRAWEKKLNALPHFTTEIDGQSIHFLHIKGSGKNPQPLLLTHGWPGSFLEFTGIIEELAHPEKFGGNAEDGLDLIIPSLPGYGFSGKPKAPVGPKYTAHLWDKLMRSVLGYDTYIAQGGDWGSVVTGWLGYNHGTNVGGGCKAIHLNMFGLRPAVLPETEEEKKWAEMAAMTFELEGAYLRLQMTKPQSLSYSMMDSPVGQAAWFMEKFNTWGDTRAPNGDNIEAAFSKDTLLTNLMLYLVTGTFNTATWYYRGMMEEGGTNMEPGKSVEIPVGIANYAGEIFNFSPRTMLEKGYNIVHWQDFDKGGHFAALETGSVFAKDVQAFIQAL